VEFILARMGDLKKPGANTTVVINNAANSLVRFENKSVFFDFQRKTL
jgi:hypothetical protein